MNGSREIQQRVIAMFDRTLSPYATVKTGEVIRWVLGALVRGKLGVLGPFFRAGKRQAAVMKELAQRRALLVRALPSAGASSAPSQAAA